MRCLSIARYLTLIRGYENIKSMIEAWMFIKMSVRTGYMAIRRQYWPLYRYSGSDGTSILAAKSCQINSVYFIPVCSWLGMLESPLHSFSQKMMLYKKALPQLFKKKISNVPPSLCAGTHISPSWLLVHLELEPAFDLLPYHPIIDLCYYYNYHCLILFCFPSIKHAVLHSCNIFILLLISVWQEKASLVNAVW